MPSDTQADDRTSQDGGGVTQALCVSVQRAVGDAWAWGWVIVAVKAAQDEPWQRRRSPISETFTDDDVQRVICETYAAAYWRFFMEDGTLAGLFPPMTEARLHAAMSVDGFRWIRTIGAP